MTGGKRPPYGIASDLGAFDHITYNVGANFEF